jgi:type VI secretion system secreted protein VgrG
MGEYTQDNRAIQIITPLGPDGLLLRSFQGQEGVSQLFRFDLHMHSENRSIQFDELVGKNATVRVFLPDGSERYFNGIINSFAQGGSTQIEGGSAPKLLSNYHATLVPWFWLLTRTSDCRIFQNMTVPEIVEKVFKEHGFSDFKNNLQGSFEAREYCVQYRETYFNFISRLLEEEGIFYFFEHEKDKHTLVLGDQPNEFKSSPLQSEVSYKALGNALPTQEVVFEWNRSQDVRTGRYALADFNFEKPQFDLTANVTGKDALKYEVYDYPGEYQTKDEGLRLVGIRMEEEESPRIVIAGSSTCRGLAAGFRFKLRDHYRRDFNGEYVVTSIYHSSDEGDNYRSSGAGQGLQYSNRFQCLPHPTAFRPPRTAPVPLMQGSQTAVVVGPKGEEIYADKYGRVKVQFHWDREGKYDEKSSCWIRVAQNWAGKRWGAMFLPRIGQEVVVDFLEGDPDRPLITGRVYNAASMPPYALPDEKTKSTVKSNSSKGGGGFNELRFEDKKGSEQVFIHAERNQDIRIKNDLMEWVGRDSHLIVKRDKSEKVEGDKHLTVTGDKNEKVGGTVSLKAGQDLQEKVGAKYGLDAGQEVHIKAGMNVVIQAGMSITLKAGGGFIVVGPAGVTISGTPVLINSGGSAGSGSGCSPQPPKAPKEADKAEPGQAVEMPPPKTPVKPKAYTPAALVMKQAARDGTPLCEP